MKTAMNSYHFALIAFFSISTVMVFADSQELRVEFFNNGIKSFQLGQYEEAISHFDQALEIDPNYVQALNNKGSALVKLGQYEEAISHFDRALKSEPKHVSSLYGKAAALEFLNRYDEAILHLDKILEIDKDHQTAIEKKRSIQTLKKLETPAFEELESKSEISYFRKGIQIYNQGNFEEAISYFDKVLEIDPHHIEALNNKGGTLMKLGQNAEAISYFDKALEIDPIHVNSMYNKAAILLTQNNVTGAITYLDHLLRVDKNHEPAKEIFDKIIFTLPFKEIDARLDIMIRDSNGNLISYIKASTIKILDHPIAEKELNTWHVKEIITIDGQNYEVHQYEVTGTNKNPVISGYTGITPPYNNNVWLIFSAHDQYMIESGDQITWLYTMYKPVEYSSAK